MKKKSDKEEINICNSWFNDFKIQCNLTIWPKWQIVIPKNVRNILWLKIWDNLIWITKCDKWLILIKSESIIEFLDYVKNELSWLTKSWE